MTLNLCQLIGDYSQMMCTIGSLVVQYTPVPTPRVHISYLLGRVGAGIGIGVGIRAGVGEYGISQETQSSFVKRHKTTHYVCISQIK